MKTHYAPISQITFASKEFDNVDMFILPIGLYLTDLGVCLHVTDLGVPEGRFTFLTQEHAQWCYTLQLWRSVGHLFLGLWLVALL